MTTKEILSKLLPVLLICIAIQLPMAACSQDEKINQWEEDTLCTPEAFEFTEEELSWPEPPTGFGNQPTDYQINWRRWKAQTERARAIRPKYEAMFWRQPNVWSVGLGFGEDEDGELIKEVGFSISVTELVPQASLPAEDRLPECLEGIPVYISVEPQLSLFP